MKKTWIMVRKCLKDYRFNSLLIRYFLLTFIIIIIPFFVIEIFYSMKISYNAMEEIRISNARELDRNVSTIDTLLLTVRNTVYNIADPLQTEFYYLSTRDEQGLMESTEKLLSANRLLRVVRKNYFFLDSVYVYLEKTDKVFDGEAVIPFAEAEDISWYDTYCEMPGNSYVMQVNNAGNKYPHLITFLYVIKDKISDKMGAVIVNVDAEKLGDFVGTGSYRKKQGESTLFMFDNETGKLLYTDEYRYYNDEEQIVEEFKNLLWSTEEFSDIFSVRDKKYIVSGKVSDDETMRYWYVTSMQNYAEKQADTQYFLRNTFLLSILLFACVSVALTISVYKPIAELHNMIEQTSQITLNDQNKKGSETEDIKQVIKTMQSQNIYLQTELDQRILSLHSAQIRALQSQIDPHFIYNTLEMIGDTFVMIANGENEATDMVCALGRLLQISLEQDSYIVTLRKELEHAKLYAELVNYRQQGNIRFYWDIPEEMLEKSVVKITLQPVIENAIFHGLRPLRYCGEIHVKGEICDNRIIIHVIDSGIGIPDEEIKRINDRLNRTEYQQIQHIGLQNVNQRIRLIFGDESGVHLVSGEGRGTDVQIQYSDVEI